MSSLVKRTMQALVEVPIGLRVYNPALTIRPPKGIEERLGYDAWTALSWALHKGWVQDYKWLFSEAIGKDVKTPPTVAAMLEASNLMIDNLNFYTSNLRGTRGLWMFMERVPFDKKDDFYELLVQGYLLGTDHVSPLWVTSNGLIRQTGVIPDEHGTNQLEGELKRYWAERERIANPFEVRLTTEIVDDYCASYNLSVDTSMKFIEKLKL